MADREKVITHFRDAIEASGDGNKWRFVRVDILEDAIDLLKEQEPRLLNFDEVKGVAYEESYRIRGEDCNPVWLERWEDTFTGLQLVLIGWRYEPDGGYSPEEYDFYALHFGSDVYGELPYKQFGKTWRVWNKLPTMGQRKAAKWR